MARRTLINLDEKILNEAVNQGAMRGVSEISALNIARKLGISDTSVFVHFKNKTNLVVSANNYALEKMYARIEQLLAPDETFTIKDRWKCMLDWFVENSNITLFLDSYAHSSYFNFKLTESDLKFVDIVRKILNDSNISYTDERCIVIWKFLLENSISLSVKIIRNVLEETEETLDIYYDLIFSDKEFVNK